MAAKILVLGSLNGKLESAFQKLATLHQKQNFAFAIIAGDVFEAGQDAASTAKLLQGEINVPLSTYFTVGSKPLPDSVVERLEKGEDICENLHYLGKRSITKTTSGIRIVTLGGILDKSIVGDQSKEQHLPLHTADDAKALKGANTADILLTSSWPSGVWAGSNVPISPEQQAAIPASDEIADLCAALKPRYHFSISPADFYYEREPFFHLPANGDSDNKAITRFMAMAPFGNQQKAKAMFAFFLNTGEALSSIPVGCTPSPLPLRKRKDPHPEVDTHRFASGQYAPGEGRYKKRRRERAPPPGPGECFFCLSNTELDTHMICSIGDESYITTAKGPLPSPDHFSPLGLSFPCHQLIIPLNHNPTLRSMGEAAESTFREMSRFKEGMQAMVASQSGGKLGAVTWEISRTRNIHTHWQLMPFSIEKLRGGLVEAAFKVEAENSQYPAFEETSIGSGVDETSDFFRVWIWSDDSDTDIQSKELVMRLDDSFRFDLQFGRRVMAKLLGLEKRLQWRDVVQPQAEEVQDVEKFKESFKPWDFTLAAES
ncbi:CwfJ C-terminus 2-domain-containing protein-like protein [Xylariaceae sp. FL0016]|nr:CwfJ C-terminus 2-domain-containing protein-like protein [Xylariaceae sp. FL0016]